MGTLSTSVNRGNGAFSLAAKRIIKGLLINIWGGCTFLGTLASLYLSVTRLYALCKIRYKLGKLLNPSIILDLAQAAKQTRSQQLREGFREEEELDRDAQYGIQIQTMPKKAKAITVYQLISIAGSAIALFLAIIGFKKQIQASFFDTPKMLLSPFIMAAALSNARERLNSMTREETNEQRRVVLYANKDAVSCTNRDAMHFKTLNHFTECSVWLFLTSLFYSVSIYTYKFSSGWYISYVPIVIAFVNLFVMLYKFILDCRYIYNCAEDNKTRLILMGITTPIKDKNETPKKLSRIRVTGKIKELINEFKNKESQCLAIQEGLDPVVTQRVELQMFQMHAMIHAMIMRHAIKTISKNTGCESFTIDMGIGCKLDKEITNPVLYKTTLNGSNTCVMKEDGSKKYEFKGSDAKIQNQYVDLEKNKEEDTHLLKALHITDITCLSTDLGSAINLVDLIAVGILVDKIPDEAQMDAKDKEIGKDFITRIEEVVPRFSSVSVAVS